MGRNVRLEKHLEIVFWHSQKERPCGSPWDQDWDQSKETVSSTWSKAVQD